MVGCWLTFWWPDETVDGWLNPLHGGGVSSVHAHEQMKPFQSSWSCLRGSSYVVDTLCCAYCTYYTAHQLTYVNYLLHSASCSTVYNNHTAPIRLPSCNSNRLFSFCFLYFIVIIDLCVFDTLNSVDFKSSNISGWLRAKVLIKVCYFLLSSSQNWFYFGTKTTSSSLPNAPKCLCADIHLKCFLKKLVIVGLSNFWTLAWYDVNLINAKFLHWTRQQQLKMLIKLCGVWLLLLLSEKLFLKCS